MYQSFLEDIFPEGGLLQDVELDYAPRFYEVDGRDLIVCWLEQGRWNLVCYKNGKPLYAEPLGKELDDHLLRAVTQLRAQMMLAEIDFAPEELILWSEVGAVRERALSGELDLNVEYQPRPAPEFKPVFCLIRHGGDPPGKSFVVQLLPYQSPCYRRRNRRAQAPGQSYR